MDNKKVKAEYKRLLDLLDRANVPQQKRDALAPIIDNIAWQRIKLDEARIEMKDAGLVCEYKNGESQWGTRENPLFKAYINLWRAYMAGLEKFAECLPKELQEEAGEHKDVLAQVLAFKKGNG